MRIENAVASRMVARADSGRFAGLCADEAAALASAGMMHQCAHVENVWHAEGLYSAEGERFDGFGTLYACSTRLCSFCMAARRKGSRREAREGMKRAGLRNKERWFLVTLTMPTLAASRAGLLSTLRTFQDAWRAFTKDGLWNEHSRASIKGVEFTLGKAHKEEGREWDAERDGYHVHIHLLAVATWVNSAKLRSEWTDCLEKTWRASGIERGINTTDGLAVCHVRYVSNRRVKRSGVVISAEGAVNEVAKYITKGESFLAIPEDQLLDVAAVRRWPRMFERLGCCRESCKCDVCQKAKGHAPREARADYLDTENLSAAFDALKGGEERRRKARRARSVPLRDRGAQLLLRGEWELWDEELAAHAATVRSYRREQLAERNAAATHRTLAGSVWYGLEANPGGVVEADALHMIRMHFGDYTDARRDEIAEADAVDAYNERQSVSRRDREEFRAILSEREDSLKGEWVNEPVVHKYTERTTVELWNGDEFITREVERSRESFDLAATNERRELRQHLRDRYEDSELIRALLFTQGRQDEWYAWITQPGAPAPYVRGKR